MVQIYRRDIEIIGLEVGGLPRRHGFIILFISLAELDLRCYLGFSLVAVSGGPLFVGVLGLHFIVVAFLIAQHRL